MQTRYPCINVQSYIRSVDQPWLGSLWKVREKNRVIQLIWYYIKLTSYITCIQLVHRRVIPQAVGWEHWYWSLPRNLQNKPTETLRHVFSELCRNDTIVNGVIFGKCYVIGAREKKEEEDTFFGIFCCKSIWEKANTINWRGLCKFAARWKEKAHSKSCCKYKALNDQYTMQICYGHLCYSEIEEFLVVTNNCNNNEVNPNKMFQTERVWVLVLQTNLMA